MVPACNYFVRRARAFGFFTAACVSALDTRIFFQRSVKLANPCLNSDDSRFRRGIEEVCSRMGNSRRETIITPAAGIAPRNIVYIRGEYF
jgi:hypothetical protein